MRSGKNERRFKSALESHERYISQVKLNYLNENVVVSGSYDGDVKLWDIRNESKPLFNLARAQKDAEDYKVFAMAWNGPNQILSGGSDSHVSVHSME